MKPFAFEGSGDHAVLLLHGLTGAPAEMYPMAKRLHRAGCTVHVPTLAGHGSDRTPLLATRWEDWYASAERAYDELARDHKTISVGGICLGAMLAVLLAARRDVAAIAAYGTTFKYDGWSMPRIASARTLIKLVAGWPLVRSIGVAEKEPYGLKDAKMRAFAVEAQRRANGGAVDAFPLGAIRELYQLADRVDRAAPKVRSPTLIVHAREDDISSSANAFRLQSRLGGPTRIELLDDSYHLVHLDRQMSEVARMTADFFNLPGRARSARTAVAVGA